MYGKKKIDNDMMTRVQGYISNAHFDKLEKFARMYSLPISRLVGIALDNEIFKKEKPFKIDLTIPRGEFEDQAFADEAGKIIKYLKKLRIGMSLDLLYLMRHDIGVPDETSFMAGFAEALHYEQIESFDAPLTSKHKAGTILYRSIHNDPVVRKKVKRKAKTEMEELREYEKLKKKFGDKV